MGTKTEKLNYLVETKFKSRGEEHYFFCSKCGSKLHAGIYRTLFCPQCRSSENPEQLIEWEMSCCHCRQAAVIMLTSDGRRVCRCDNPSCGDLFSMQDLTGIGLEAPIGG
ncbi:MAG: hypothetical protein WC441_04010 [Patescibacteria group bacterium]